LQSPSDRVKQRLALDPLAPKFGSDGVLICRKCGQITFKSVLVGDRYRLTCVRCGTIHLIDKTLIKE
jgi:hypothetical protein